MDFGVRASAKETARGFKLEDLMPDAVRSAAEPGPSTVVEGITSILSKLEAIDAKIDRLQEGSSGLKGEIRRSVALSMDSVINEPQEVEPMPSIVVVPSARSDWTFSGGRTRSVRRRASTTSSRSPTGKARPHLEREYPSIHVSLHHHHILGGSSGVRKSRAERHMGLAGLRRRAFFSIAASFQNPASKVSFVFSLLACVLVWVELTAFPYLWAWSVQGRAGVAALCCTSACFWTVAMMRSFVLGYFSDGRLVTEKCKIMRRYFRAWFIFDVVALAGDWTIMLLELDDRRLSKSVSLLKFMRLLKITRMISVFRLIRTWPTVYEFCERMCSLQGWDCTMVHDAARMAAVFFHLMVFTLWMTHVSACLWFLVGRDTISDTGERWVSESDTARVQYVKAFQWSVATGVGGSTKIEAKNSNELLYCTFASAFGFVINSMMIALLTSMLTDLQARAAESNKKFVFLHRFLHTYSVSPALCQGVYKYVKHHMMHTTILREDVELLDLCPESLQKTLKYEILKRHVVTYPLFEFLHALRRETPEWCQRDFSGALEHKFVEHSDDLFIRGKEAKGAWYVVSGHVVYTFDDDSDELTSDIARRHSVSVSATVHSGSWLSIASLWLLWDHVGRAVVDGELGLRCEFVLVDAEKFAEAVATNAEVSKVVCSYAAVWRKLAVADGELHSPITDVGGIGTAWEEPLWSKIVHGMDHEVSREASMMAFVNFDMRIRKSWLTGESAALCHDISSNLCTFTQNCQHDFEKRSELFRFRVHIKIAMGEGAGSTSPRKTLWVMGKLCDGELKVRTQLPEGRRPRDKEFKHLPLLQEAEAHVLKDVIPWLTCTPETLRLEERTSVEVDETHPRNTDFLAICNIYTVVLTAEVHSLEDLPPTSALKDLLKRGETASQTRSVGTASVGQMPGDISQTLRRFSTSQSQGLDVSGHELVQVHVHRGIVYALLSEEEEDFFRPVAKRLSRASGRQSPAKNRTTDASPSSSVAPPIGAIALKDGLPTMVALVPPSAVSFSL